MAIYSVAECGAAGDGNTLDTAAIQEALDRAGADGGGTVTVPPGTYRTGTLILRDHVCLEIGGGATLLGSDRLEDYPPTTPDDGDVTPHHLIYAEGAQGVTIRGPGAIKGNGPSFWLPPLHGSWKLARNPHRPSPMLDLRRCSDVRLCDVTLADAGGWTVQFRDCDRVWARGVRIVTPEFGPNNDGFDVCGCADVTIEGCHIQTSDDAIVAFPSPDRDCERLTVTGCVIATTCAAFKTYTDPGRAVRQLVFANSVVHRSSRMVGLYAGLGGLVEDVLISGLVGDTNSGLVLNRPIHLDAGTHHEPGPAVMRNIVVSGVACRTEGRVLVTAPEDTVLENVTLRDIQLTYTLIEDPQTAGGPYGGQMSIRTPEALAARAAVVAEGVRNLCVDNLMIHWPAEGTDGEEVAWHDGPRAANGVHEVFPPLVRTARPPMSAFWGRRIEGGLLRCPLARASTSEVAAVILDQCQMQEER